MTMKPRHSDRDHRKRVSIMTDVVVALNASRQILSEFLEESRTPDEFTYFTRVDLLVAKAAGAAKEALAWEERESIRTQIAELESRLKKLGDSDVEEDSDHPEPHCDTYHELMEGEHKGG